MSRKGNPVTYLSRNLCTVLVASLLLLALPSSAGATGNDDADRTNTVNLTIRGGDATALATCLNVAKERGDDSARQENSCQNTAVATGGTVILRNVDITIVQTNKA